MHRSPALQTKAAVQPTDTLLVVDAMTGQEAAALVKSFADAVDITGAVSCRRCRCRCRDCFAISVVVFAWLTSDCIINAMAGLIAAADWNHSFPGIAHTHMHLTAPHCSAWECEQVLTKMDGDSRGGAALSIREVSGRPIKFVGTGEKMEALEPFYPERMASRILGAWCVVWGGVVWCGGGGWGGVGWGGVGGGGVGWGGVV